MKSPLSDWKKDGLTIGFVPTMGALHAGHLDLVRRARSQSDRVVVSIFVNPLQFNNAADLEKYPRHLEQDARLLEEEGVHLLFAPDSKDFYPERPLTGLDFGSISAGLEGAMRPGHFSGVGVVLARLFHLIMPDVAFFGAKDLQQVAVVQALVRDLGFPLEIVRCPTVREEHGLAMSSRNVRLSPEGRKKAALLFQTLQEAVQAERQRAGTGKSAGLDRMGAHPEFELEYLELVDTRSMEVLPARNPKVETAFCLAAWLEGVRLIDNCIIEPD